MEKFEQKEKILELLNKAESRLWNLQFQIRKRNEQILEVSKKLGSVLSSEEFENTAKLLIYLHELQTNDEASLMEPTIEVARLDALFKEACLDASS